MPKRNTRDSCRNMARIKVFPVTWLKCKLVNIGLSSKTMPSWIRLLLLHVHNYLYCNRLTILKHLNVLMPNLIKSHCFLTWYWHLLTYLHKFTCNLQVMLNPPWLTCLTWHYTPWYASYASPIIYHKQRLNPKSIIHTRVHSTWSPF